ncbi:MAG: preprotein translocase subunit YajC [Planctomycetota bacterium]|nr:MAG: preprotein translocase subunit YajC [Planctomycetota bacterium]
MAWMQPLLLFGLLFLFMWFMVIRPERRRQKERAAMLGAIRKGDEVTTTAGIYGKVAALGEDTITLDVADGVRLKFERNAIARIRSSRDADDSSDSARKEPEKGKLVSAGK